MKLREALARKDVDLRQIRERLDSVDQAERIAEMRSLSGAEQARLFDAAKGFLPVTLESVLPTGTDYGVNEGKNSLLAYTRFAKVFYRGENPAELCGFNRNGWVVSTFVGPGYFVAHRQGDELVIDYTRLPTRQPEGWPAILDNGSRLSKLVYHGTKDMLRGVSKHVTIGRASRNGKNLDNWFVLCRTE